MFILKSTHKKVVSNLERTINLLRREYALCLSQLQANTALLNQHDRESRSIIINKLKQERLLKQQRRQKELARMKKYYQEVLKERTRNGYTRIDSNGIVISNVTNKPVKRYKKHKKHKYVPSI